MDEIDDILSEVFEEYTECCVIYTKTTFVSFNSFSQTLEVPYFKRLDLLRLIIKRGLYSRYVNGRLCVSYIKYW